MALDYVREGFAAFAQDLIYPTICSSFFIRMPLLYFLALRGGQTTKDSMRIGRPGAAQLFTGMPLDKAKQEELAGGNAIQVNIHTKTTDYTKRLGAKDKRPTITNSQVNSQDNNYGTAEFRRHRKATPIKIWHSSIRRAEREAGGNADVLDNKVKNIVRNATDEAMNVHMDSWAFDFWNGGTNTTAPDGTNLVVDQDQDPWIAPLGVIACMDTSNTYGRVDRSRPGAVRWKGKRVTDTFAPDIFEVIDEMNMGQSCADTGDGVTLILCTKKQFRKYKRQARKEGHTYWSAGVPEMAQMGFQREVIRVDNTYVTWDPLCPAGYAAGINLYTWFFSADKNDNFRVTDFKSMCDNGQDGGDEADKADVITEGILGCHAPYANCLMTAIAE